MREQPFTIRMDMSKFNRHMSRVQQALRRNPARYVLANARRLVKRAAYACPRAKAKWAKAGRARAGFWPAAKMLNVTTIYTKQPDQGEGKGLNHLAHAFAPSGTIRTTVPSITTITRHGLGWWDKAIAEAMKQMDRDLEKHVHQICAGVLLG